MPDFGLTVGILLVLLYIGTIFGFYTLFNNRIKKETGLTELNGWTYFTMVIAAISMPGVILGAIRLLLTILIWVLV